MSHTKDGVGISKGRMYSIIDDKVVFDFHVGNWQHQILYTQQTFLSSLALLVWNSCYKERFVFSHMKWRKEWRRNVRVVYKVFELFPVSTKDMTWNKVITIDKPVLFNSKFVKLTAYKGKRSLRCLQTAANILKWLDRNSEKIPIWNNSNYRGIARAELTTRKIALHLPCYSKYKKFRGKKITPIQSTLLMATMWQCKAIL